MPLERHAQLSMLDVLDRVLDKGIVIDYWSRLFLLGIDVMTTIEGRAVVASLETYLRHETAIRRSSIVAGQMSPQLNSKWAVAVTRPA